MASKIIEDNQAGKIIINGSEAGGISTLSNSDANNIWVQTTGGDLNTAFANLESGLQTPTYTGVIAQAKLSQLKEARQQFAAIARKATAVDTNVELTNYVPATTGWSMCMMSDGRVLCVPSVSTVSCYIFDPTTNSFSNTGTTGRGVHPKGTLLKDGRCAFYSSSTVPDYLQIYTPSTNSWSVYSSPYQDMLAPVVMHNGNLAVIGSGRNTTLIYTFDITTNTYTSTNLYSPLYNDYSSYNYGSASAILLSDGKIFIVAGPRAPYRAQSNTICGIYDPIAGTTYATGYTGLAPGSTASTGPAILLLDGRVLVPSRLGSLSKIYDPATNAFSSIGISIPRESSMCMLHDGRVFIAYNGTVGTTPSIYDPVTNQLYNAGGSWPTSLSTANYNSCITLQDGRVLLMPDVATTQPRIYTPHATLNAPSYLSSRCQMMNFSANSY